jgi:membrane protein required for colicin V production
MNPVEQVGDLFRQLGWVDITLLTILSVSVLVGLWRGLTFEVISLLGWLVAFVIANSCGPMLADVLPVAPPGSGLRMWICYALVFFFVLISCALLARMLRALISATPLSAVDRLLGGVFGVVRGALVLVIVATLVSLSPAAGAEVWRSSYGALWLGQALELMRPALPPALSSHLRSAARADAAPARA